MRGRPSRPLALWLGACLACALAALPTTSAAGPAPGVHFDVEDVFAAAGWAEVYREPYSDNTLSADLDAVSEFNPASCVVVGAKRVSDAVLRLAAFTSVEAFGTKTTASETYQSRGVLWYRNPGTWGPSGQLRDTRAVLTAPRYRTRPHSQELWVLHLGPVTRLGRHA